MKDLVRLVRVEARRLAGRSLFRLFFLLFVCAIVAGGVWSFVGSSRDMRAARARAEAEHASCIESLRSLEEFGALPPPGARTSPDSACPPADSLLRGQDRRFVFALRIEGITRGVALAALGVAFVVGASFAGAEWGTGALATFLTWEPRRRLVLAAKAAGTFLLVVPAVTLLLALLAVVHLPAGVVRGTMVDTTASLWRHLAGMWAKGGVLAGMGALAGVGAAMIARNTAGAVGAGIAYFAILDPLASSELGAGRFRGWFCTQLVQQLLAGPVREMRPAPPGVYAPGGFVEVVRPLPPWRPAGLLAAYVVCVLLAAYASFRRRDVT